MRASLALARRLPPHPRVLHRRPRISLATNIASLCRYSNNAGSTENSQKQSPTHPEPLTNGSSASPFETASKYLFSSAVAAGLGYAYAASNQSSKPQSQPQSQSQTPSQSTKGPNYGSPQDYEKVSWNVAIVIYCARRSHVEKCLELGHRRTTNRAR